MALVSQRGHCPKALSLRSLQQAIYDLALNEFAEEWNILRSVKKIHQPRTCVDQFNRGLADSHSARAIRRLRHMDVLCVQNVPNSRDIQLDPFVCEFVHRLRFFRSLDPLP